MKKEKVEIKSDVEQLMEYIFSEPHIANIVSNTKSYLEVGEMIFGNSRRFNWLERKMWKYLLGVKITNKVGGKR